MECPKCHGKKFKHSGDDLSCWNCGQLVMAPVTVHVITLPKPSHSKITQKGRPIDQVSAEIRSCVANHLEMIKSLRMNGSGWKSIAATIGLGGGSKAAVQRHYTELTA